MKAKGKKIWAGSRKEVEPFRAQHLTINVTKEDIARGVACEPNVCVVACAIHREHPEWQRIAVDAATIRYTRKQKDGTRLRCTHLTPPKLQRVVIATDNNMKDKLRPVKAVAAPGFIAVSAPVGRPRKGPSAAKRKAIAKLKKKPVLKRMQGSNIPIVVGGKEPPRLSQRRAFGIRAGRI